MSTTTRVTTDPGEFKATVFPFLQGDPVLHSVVLSNTEDRIKGLLHDPAPPVFVSVHGAGGSVVGAVMRTALRGIYLGGLADALVPAVVDAYAAATGDGDAYAPVVEGTATAARLFAEEWSGRFDKEYSKTRGSRTSAESGRAARQNLVQPGWLLAQLCTARAPLPWVLGYCLAGCPPGVGSQSISIQSPGVSPW